MSRLVLKFGTGVLSRLDGRALDAVQFRRIADEVSELVKAGHSCVLVSSAAIAAGVSVLGLENRPEDLPGKQACAAAGQPELMRMWATAFRRHGLSVAQLLLTHDDIDSRMRHKNARNTLERLLEHGGIVPVINENDSVAVEELRLGDNDRLSAEVAVLFQADKLLVLTSSDGLTDQSKKRIPIIRDMEKAFNLVRPEKGRMSVGGMKTKLEAVQLALAADIPAIIIDGKKKGDIVKAAAFQDVGTRFPTPRTKRS
jgi:glutamate 5-kinase